MTTGTKTCGNCGHNVQMYASERKHRCDVTRARIGHLSATCERWAHRPAARVRVEPGEIMRAKGGYDHGAR